MAVRPDLLRAQPDPQSTRHQGGVVYAFPWSPLKRPVSATLRFWSGG